MFTTDKIRLQCYPVKVMQGKRNFAFDRVRSWGHEGMTEQVIDKLYKIFHFV